MTKNHVDDPILGGLEQTMRKQVLRAAVSRQMFCPNTDCGGVVLDMGSAVLIEAGPRMFILCPDCADTVLGRIPADKVVQLEITDGRTL